MENKIRIPLLAALVAVTALFGEASAQPFPSRAVHLVVPFPPGGPTDLAARVIGELLGKGFGEPVVVENRPGGSTIVASGFVARAAPDGHTLLMVVPSFVINPAMRSDLPFEPLKDFTAVGRIYFTPQVVAVHPSVPAKSLQELIALARRKPGELSFGESGTTNRVLGERLKLAAKIDMVHVSYPGSGPALNALIGGQIPVLVGNATEVAPQAKAGKLRALVVTSGERTDVLPDVPTVREAGYPELEAVNWAGLVAPAATPPAAIARVNEELRRALADPAVQAKLKSSGLTPAGGTTEQFRSFLQAEYESYGKAVRAAGIKAD
jgi:tripartite-type tricarboxylate transporter receptor subunit TctC